MKKYLIYLITLIGVASKASTLASTPVCVTTNSGGVYLVSSFQYLPNKLQQMVYFVGKETWSNPEDAINQCRILSKSFNKFIGERWLPKECGCFGKSISERIILFRNDSGNEIPFYAHNQIEFRDALDTNIQFRIVTPNDPACFPDPDPMCGH